MKSGPAARRAVIGLVLLTVLASACGFNSRGPWIDEHGRRLGGNEVIEYDGFAACDQQRIVFLRFFGDTYAYDEFDRLGTLTSPDTGEVLTYAVLDELPPSAVGTGITHAGEEIYVADDRADYLYIRLPSGMVQRWPRAERSCVRG